MIRLIADDRIIEKNNNAETAEVRHKLKTPHAP
jgi:hypothetical protein